MLGEASDWMHDELEVTEQWPRRFQAEPFIRAIERREQQFAMVEGAIAATLRVQTSDPAVWGDSRAPALYIHSLAVRDGWRGRGVGSLVLDAVQRRGIEIERPALRLDCVAWNDGLRTWYERLGFQHRGDVEQRDGEEVWYAARFERAALPG